MAAKTPATSGSGFVGQIDECYVALAGLAVTETYLANGTKVDAKKYTLARFYFSDIDPDDTWASGKPIIACAWQPNDVDSVLSPSVSADSAGLVTFKATAGGNQAGFLWCLMDDPGFKHGKRQI